MTFGEKLKELRTGAALTQEQLSAAAVVPLSTLRGYEQGQRIPGFGAIVRLSRSLGQDCRAFADCIDIGEEVAPPAKAKRKK